jgi:hypothetical protein
MHNNKRRQNNMNGGGGQHRHHNNRPRRFNNNRPSGGNSDDPANVARVRRNATQNREKYQSMARDAQGSGDRVLMEYYLQHAEHYHRVLAELPPEEVRHQHYQQRNPTQGSDMPQGDHMQDGMGAPLGEEAPPPSHDLPSFITRPQAGGEQGE